MGCPADTRTLITSFAAHGEVAQRQQWGLATYLHGNQAPLPGMEGNGQAGNLDLDHIEVDIAGNIRRSEISWLCPSVH